MTHLRLRLVCVCWLCDVRHTHPQMEAADEHTTEYLLEFEEAHALLQVGGFVGVRPNGSTYPQYKKSMRRDTCAGSSSSFAQNLEFFARELALPVCFATDFNGGQWQHLLCGCASRSRFAHEMLW